MSKILAVTKEGKDALNSSDPNDFVFYSNYNTLKYYVQGTKTVTVDQADYYDSDPGVPPFIPATYYHYKSETVAHNLDYVPYFAGYYHLNTSSVCQAPYSIGDFVFFAYLAVYADDTNLYFVAHFNSTLNSGNVELDFSYRIFKNSLDL